MFNLEVRRHNVVKQSIAPSIYEIIFRNLENQIRYCSWGMKCNLCCMHLMFEVLSKFYSFNWSQWPLNLLHNFNYFVFGRIHRFVPKDMLRYFYSKLGMPFDFVCHSQTSGRCVDYAFMLAATCPCGNLCVSVIV